MIAVRLVTQCSIQNAWQICKTSLLILEQPHCRLYFVLQCPIYLNKKLDRAQAVTKASLKVVCLQQFNIDIEQCVCRAYELPQWYHFDCIYCLGSHYEAIGIRLGVYNLPHCSRLLPQLSSQAVNWVQLLETHEFSHSLRVWTLSLGWGKPTWIWLRSNMDGIEVDVNLPDGSRIWKLIQGSCQ